MSHFFKKLIKNPTAMARQAQVLEFYEKGAYSEMVSMMVNMSLQEFKDIKQNDLTLLHDAIIRDHSAVEHLSKLPFFKEIVNDD
jgi:hypothetical protein